MYHDEYHSAPWNLKQHLAHDTGLMVEEVVVQSSAVNNTLVTRLSTVSTVGDTVTTVEGGNKTTKQSTEMYYFSVVQWLRRNTHHYGAIAMTKTAARNCQDKLGLKTRLFVHIDAIWLRNQSHPQGTQQVNIIDVDRNFGFPSRRHEQVNWTKTPPPPIVQSIRYGSSGTRPEYLYDNTLPVNLPDVSYQYNNITQRQLNQRCPNIHHNEQGIPVRYSEHITTLSQIMNASYQFADEHLGQLSAKGLGLLGMDDDNAIASFPLSSLTTAYRRPIIPARPIASTNRTGLHVSPLFYNPNLHLAQPHEDFASPEGLATALQLISEAPRH
ncbi:hypothetical protein CONLIGDRAFT_649969 [Coniochaeta ligniaria NRRL 30616]|uniref:Uncharacterized protein n=1 Tax=Coniochaeta ligniaria NRRL 30616 TaxID=1408157 RepID=A0A1J7I6V6_9PEZI|nr:hypothetical protein CONLIGDRAFT_649969 [Coniochaeta ligniaria NRRL 30616]